MSTFSHLYIYIIDTFVAWKRRENSYFTHLKTSLVRSSEQNIDLSLVTRHILIFKPTLTGKDTFAVETLVHHEKIVKMFLWTELLAELLLSSGGQLPSFNFLSKSNLDYEGNWYKILVKLSSYLSFPPQSLYPYNHPMRSDRLGDSERPKMSIIAV